MTGNPKVKRYPDRLKWYRTPDGWICKARRNAVLRVRFCEGDIKQDWAPEGYWEASYDNPYTGYGEASFRWKNLRDAKAASKRMWKRNQR